MNKKYLLSLVISLVVFGSLVAPFTAQAGLVICGLSEDDPKTTNIKEDEECTLCHLFATANNLLDGFTIYLVTPIAGLAIAWAAFRLITSGGDPSAKADAKNLLLNILKGLVIIWGAWLLIDFIIQQLVDPSGPVSMAWNKIEC